jgi:hypothetical protein
MGKFSLGHNVFGQEDPIRLYGKGKLVKENEFLMGAELEIELDASAQPDKKVSHNLHRDTKGFHCGDCEDGYCCGDCYGGYKCNDRDEDDTYDSKVMLNLGRCFTRFAALKSDGTISWGTEICSRPTRFREQVNQWKKRLIMFKQSNPQNHEYALQESPRTCGFHIHVAREVKGQNGMNDRATQRAEDFIMAPNHADFMQGLAGRSLVSGQGGRFAQLRPNSRGAFHPRTHHGTNEYRMFVSYPEPNIIARHLESAHAISTFSMGDQALSLNEFVQYVHSHSREYANLWKMLKKTGTELKLEHAGIAA